MNIKKYRYLQASILFCLASFLLETIITGKLVWYINQRFMPLTILALIVLCVIAIGLVIDARQPSLIDDDHTHEQDSDHDHDHAPSLWRLAVILVPLLIGILIPAQPLAADAMSGKSVSSAALVSTSSSNPTKLDQAADQRNILDWIRMFNSTDSSSIDLRQSANVIGFVYHDPRLKDGQFLVSRFAIVCCAADAFAISMVVDWPQSAALPNDQWIKVKGPVQTTQLADQKMPLIQATSIDSVSMPDQPYLFP